MHGSYRRLTGGTRAAAQLIVGVLVLVLSISCWFATGAALPSLIRDFGLDTAGRLTLTMAVQLGFAAGAIAVGCLRLPDRVHPNILLPLGALAAALSTGLPLLLQTSLPVLVASRALVGASLAVVYPTGMRTVISWFGTRGRGLAVGAVAASLAVGTAAPQLLVTAPLGDWQSVFLATGGAALVAAGLATLLRPGPEAAPMRPTSFQDLRLLAADPLQRRIAIGYIAHMWEAYGLWVWLPIFLVAGGAGAIAPSKNASGVLSFFIIGVAGAVGCIVGGGLSKWFGKRRVARGIVALSFVCAATTPFLSVIPSWLAIALLIIWGAAVIADSPLYSSLTGDLAAGKPVGTALALQMGIGYVLSAVAIGVTGAVGEGIGWEWAFLVVAPGPLVALVCLRPWASRPDTFASLETSGPPPDDPLVE